MGAGLVYGYIRYRNDQIARVPVAGLTDGGGAGQPMTVLLVGSNTRTGLDPSEAKDFGSAADVGGARSDVTMLVHFDPQAHSVSLLSIPRDLWMPVPGTDRQQRVDAALNTGPDQLVQVIEQDLGIPINHYVELNFDTFQSVVDTLGGINMEFPTKLRDSFSGLNQTQTGCVHLNGPSALALVRARHLQYYANGRYQDDPYGDLSRIRRNHEFLRVLAGALQRKGVSDPLTVNALVGSVAPALKVDSSLSLSVMVGLARRYRNVSPANVPTLTLPVVAATGYRFRGVDYGDVVLPDQPLDNQTIDTFMGRSTPAGLDAKPGTVDIVDQSGKGLGAQIGSGLTDQGFTVTGTESAPSPASPAESVVYYGPGQLAGAQRLAAALSGSVILGQYLPPLGAQLQLVVGTDVSVVAPGQGATSTTVSTTVRTTVGTTGNSSGQGSTTTVPAGVTVVGNAEAVQEQPLFFDPTSCAPGVPGQ